MHRPRAQRLRSTAACAALLAAACGGAEPPGSAGSEEADPAPRPATHEPHEGAGGRALDRHALHVGVEAKGTSLHELQSAWSVLVVLGEDDAAPYRELLAELAAVGSDEAAALALAWRADERVTFEGRAEAFAEALRTLAASPAVDARRGELERALAADDDEEAG